MNDAALVLDLDGYEGPIDLLLALAREQKVDLARISILELADQYLAFIAEQRRLQLEVAADYLVMAAWLAYLKSRPGRDRHDRPAGVRTEPLRFAPGLRQQPSPPARPGADHPAVGLPVAVGRDGESRAVCRPGAGVARADGVPPRGIARWPVKPLGARGDFRGDARTGEERSRRIAPGPRLRPALFAQW